MWEPAMHRRTFLQLGAAALAAPILPRPALAEDGFIELRVASATAPLMGGEAAPTPVWAYNGSVPGPEVRIGRGETVRVRLVNDGEQPTTIHWHGVRIDNAMDGAAGVTQEPVPPGGSFDYVFKAPDAGSFWYHSHDRSWEQVARGLYGTLIVEGDMDGVDRDLSLVIDDWRLTKDGAIDEASFGHMHDWSHAGRLGNWVTVNGRSDPVFDLAAGRPVRLRLFNVANARIFELALDGLDAELVGLDGQAFQGPRPLSGVHRLWPGQRADLVVAPRAAGTARLMVHNRGEAFQIASFEIAAAPPGTAAAEWRLRPNALPEPDLGEALAVDLLMEGGAMGSLAAARHHGDLLPMRELVQRGVAWAMNGHAGHGGAPLFSAPRGRTVRLTMINDTRWPHGMHLHGHHVRVVDRNGAPEPEAAWRDTVGVEALEEVEVVFVADNPGKWLIHCHMLEHHAGGMVTWFEVT
jgi:FtsP/CotA-like multicopper oxidase with cupredoxin domain